MSVAAALRASENSPCLSLVVPAYNEADSLPALYERICAVLDEPTTWELIVVDDGSRDDTARVLAHLMRDDRRVRAVSLDRNYGQTTATRVGIEMACAPLIATLDADLQNDPADLPDMLAALGDADAIVGYRVARQDTLLRRVSSQIANRIRNRLTGDHVEDTGCALKVFRAEVLRRLPLFEGMHRFLPTLVRLGGFTCREHPVSHRPRVAGRSKYNIRNRIMPSFVDLLAVRWMRTRISRPVVKPLWEEFPG